MSENHDLIFEFPPFRLDPSERLLWNDGHLVAVESPTAFDLLYVLVQNPGKLLSRETLLQAVWKGTHVDSNTLNAAISNVRKMLEDSRAEHRFVQTVHKSGYRFVAPVRVLRRDTCFPPASSAERRVSADRRLPRFVISVASLTFVSLAFVLPRLGEISEKFRPFLLTGYMGHEYSPAVSPDGTQVAFSWEQPGEDRDIYVLKLGDKGPPRQLTKTADHDDSPAWSPDGRQIAFVRNRGHDGAIWVADSSGGGERTVAATRGLSVAWTADQSKLVFDDIVPGEERSALFTVSIEGAARHRLTYPSSEPGHGDFGPSISPDGKRVAFSRRLTYNNSDVHVAPITGGETLRVTRDQRPIGGVAWTPDGRQLIFSSARTGTYRLWRTAPHSRSQPEPVKEIGEDVLHPSLPSKVSTPPWPLVFERSERDYNVWMIDRRRPKTAAYAARGLISSARMDQAPAISPDGKRIALTSDRSGFFELWVCDFPLGRNCERLTWFQGAYVGSPSWSPDGRILACDARVDGNADIYSIRAHVSEPKRLTRESSVESRPGWSRDGRWIYYRSDRTGRHEIWKTPAEGGDAVQVTDSGGFEAFESRDGAQLYFLRSRSSVGLWRRRLHSGIELPVRELHEITASAWVPSRKGIYWLDASAFPSQYVSFIKYFDAYGGEVRRLGEVRGWVIPTATGFSVSEDERYIVWSQLDRDIQDLMVVAEFR